MDTPGDSNSMQLLVSSAWYGASLLFSAYFASAETAYTAVSRVRLRTLADKGGRKGKRAKKALWICDRFDKTLTTILIGNNVFHAICAAVSAMLVLHALGEEYVPIGTLVTTLVVYLFAEMIPKCLAKARSEETALLYASGMVFLVKIFTPVSAVFSLISRFLSRLFRSENKKTVTEEELLSLIETIEDEGVLDPDKQALVNSAIEFREKRAKDIMTPMGKVVSVPIGMPRKELVALLKTCPYSRLPVYEGKPENIVGILPVNVFLSLYAAGRPTPLRKILLKPYIFDSETEISELLQRMRLNKLHMIFVTDENREKIGILTMEDLLEELVGEIQDESDAGEGLQLA